MQGTAGDLGCRMGQVEQLIRYVYWNSRSSGIVIGMSGGVDSAVAAAFCCRAVGPEKVLCLFLPAAVTGARDGEDVALLCASLGTRLRTVNIEPVLEAFRGLPGFTPSPRQSGNLMARVRMAILYYQANQDNRIVCGTSNRSEYMLGYCTKYGDNAADVQPILHLYKSDVYEMAEELRIPESIVRKAPSAGLWVGQTDEGEIGLTYDRIDAALRALEEHDGRPENPAEERVLAMVQKNGHKRAAVPSLLGAPQRQGSTAPGS